MMKHIRKILIAALSLLTTSLVPAADCLTAPSGLLSWWKATGDPFDSAGTKDGELVGPVQFGPGIVGPGFLFTGDGGDWVRLPNNLFPVPFSGEGDTPFTFETWFQTTAHGVILGQQDVVPYVDLGGYVPALYVGTNGFLFAALFHSDAPVLTSPAPVNDGLFHHVAVTYDGSTQVLYLDGVVVGSTPMVQLGYAATYHYQLGTGFTGGWPETTGGWFPFSGIVDEPCLYNRALAPAEIALLAQATGGKCGGPVLRQRYSFDGEPGSRVVRDSIRAADGVLHFATLNAPYTNGTPDGSGFTGSGALQLNGVSGYVALPPRLVSLLSNITIEAWITWSGPTTVAWQRIFDFGAHDRQLGLFRHGTNYLMLCPSRGDQYVVGFQQTRVDPLGGSPDPNGHVLYGNAALPVGQPVYLALTYDPPAGRVELFLNGSLVSSGSGLALNWLNRFFDENNWLGRSQWGPDPFFSGAFDEFRIWDGVLSAATISSHHAAGPNQSFVITRPKLSIGRVGNNLVLSWPGGEGGFQVQSSASLNNPDWQRVDATVSQDGAGYQVTLPATGTSAFYRLAK